MNALEIKNMSAWLDDVRVLEDVNLAIEEREYLGIIGPNGGGKTTLLKVILGLVEKVEGEVKVFDKPPEKARSLIGYVPQYNTFDRNYPISVWDVAASGTLNKNRKKNDDRIRQKLIGEALEKTGLVDYKDRQAGELSGGEIQRLTIARALASDPKMLLLDEPTASIDTVSGKNFYDLLSRLNEEITLILVSHDIGAISSQVKKIACLNKKLVFHDSKEINKDMLEETYQCPVDLIAHGLPHRVLDEHHNKESEN